MKKTVKLLAGLLACFTLASCSSNTSKTRVLYVGGLLNESEYNVWKEQKRADHENKKAEEKITVTFCGREYTGIYTGNSAVEEPDMFLSNEYIRAEDSAPFICFKTNGNTEKLCEFTAVTPPGKGGSLIPRIAREKADAIASEYLDVNRFDVKGAEGEKCSFIYQHELNGLTSQSGLKIVLDNNGNPVYLKNTLDRDFEEWFENTSLQEKKRVIDACTSAEVRKEINKKLCSLLKEKDGDIRTAVTERKMVMSVSGKPAVWYRIDVKDIRGGKTDSLKSGEVTFLVEYK